MYGLHYLFLRYIPKASLAAVIICAVIFMIEYEVVVPVWKTRPLDQIPLWVSFITCLLWKLEFGIVVGAGVDIAILLYGAARPKVGVNPVSKQVSTYCIEFTVTVFISFPTKVRT